MDSVLGQAGAILSYNLFGYCSNDPVRMRDSDGHRYEDSAGGSAFAFGGGLGDNSGAGGLSPIKAMVIAGTIVTISIVLPSPRKRIKPISKFKSDAKATAHPVPVPYDIQPLRLLDDRCSSLKILMILIHLD